MLCLMADARHTHKYGKQVVVVAGQENNTC
jgi:hypothetical protein